MQKSHRVSIGVSDEEYAALQVVAQKHDVSMAWIGRQAILAFLSNYEQNENKALLPLSGASEGRK
jgi:predicted transcriptional regulator